MTLYPATNFTAVSNAGIKDVTLAFITSNPQAQPAWGGYSAYTINGGSDISYIDNQIAALRSAGISPTISFGGQAGQDLAYTAPSAAALAAQYQQVVSTYGIYKLDFDVEGAMQANNAVLTTQAQAIAMLQQQQTAAGTPITVSYTLPVLPSGLVAGPNGGLNVLQIANANGVKISTVNIMAMDYYDPSVTDMGTAAIEAARATHSQLMTMYPSMSSQQVWSMIGVTPMIGVNDDPSEIFSLADAQELTAFAQQNNISALSMWSLARDTTGTVGVATSTGSGVTQTPLAYSLIFDQFGSVSQT
ncbi:chitinase [Mycobacterium ostraviense]|nr:chitinase [Mycobacterium ostraviense]UGT94641.1 chitinase [Mycobacterium ostraviense]